MMGKANGKTAVGDICKSGQKILYAWAMDAPKFKLPEGISFKVAGDTSIKSLVLQVHYKMFVPFSHQVRSTQRQSYGELMSTSICLL